MTRKEVRTKVAAFIADNPRLSYKEIGLKMNCATSTIATVAREYGIVRQRGALTETDLDKLNSENAPEGFEGVIQRKMDEEMEAL